MADRRHLARLAVFLLVGVARLEEIYSKEE